jgi:hypothetical protein
LTYFIINATAISTFSAAVTAKMQSKRALKHFIELTDNSCYNKNVTENRCEYRN